MMILPLRAFLKRSAHLGALALLLTATSACPEDDKQTPSELGPNDDDEADAGTGQPSTSLTGSYTVDGVKYSCKVSTQLFPATKEFSVVCQHDGNGLVQITFKDEASARLTQTLKLIEPDIFNHPDADTISVDYMPFADGQKSVSSTDDGADSASGKTSGSHKRAHAHRRRPGGRARQHHQRGQRHRTVLSQQRH